VRACDGEEEMSVCFRFSRRDINKGEIDVDQSRESSGGDGLFP